MELSRRQMLNEKKSIPFGSIGLETRRQTQVDLLRQNRVDKSNDIFLNSECCVGLSSKFYEVMQKYYNTNQRENEYIA